MPRPSEIHATCQWFVETGQMPQVPAPDPRQIAFYTGMQLEEMAEKLEVLLGSTHPFVVDMHAYGNAYKSGQLPAGVSQLDPVRAKALLDADVDLLWVTIGGARSQGADVEGAYMHLIERNYAKRWPDGTFHRHLETGKVLKPEGWVAPNHAPFIHPSLR